MRCFRRSHHVHLLVPTRHSRVVWLIFHISHRALLDPWDDSWDKREQASSDLLNALTRGSSLDPLPLLTYQVWVQGPQLRLHLSNFSCTLIKLFISMYGLAS